MWSVIHNGYDMCKAGKTSIDTSSFRIKKCRPNHNGAVLLLVTDPTDGSRTGLCSNDVQFYII